MQSFIEVEDSNTWPPEALNLLKENFNLLSLYTENEIAYPNIPLPERLYYVNPYKDKRESIIEQLDEILEGHNLVGYHCTRLLDHEIVSIKNNGMNPLSLKFFEKRVKQAINNGSFGAETGQYLLENNLCSEPFRQGMLWFVCGVSMLKDEDGVGKFFRGWGGEAIYNWHENNELSWSILKSIGHPCIIRAALTPIKIFPTTWSIGMNLEQAFLQNKGIETPNNPQFDAHMKHQLPSEQILKIILIDDPEFSELTNYEKWKKKIN